MKITGNTDVVTEHEASGSGHYAWNDDDRSDLGLEFGAAVAGWTCKPSGRHDCVFVCVIFQMLSDTICFRKKKKDYMCVLMREEFIALYREWESTRGMKWMMLGATVRIFPRGYYVLSWRLVSPPWANFLTCPLFFSLPIII